MPSLNSNPSRPIVAISACLMGQNVRYDGEHQYNELVESTLKPIAQLNTFCPEVAAGLGTPRPPVKLVALGSGEDYGISDLRAIGVDDTSIDVTIALKKIAKLYTQLFEHVDGIVFKARSPSCGVKDTPIEVQKTLIQGRGLFASIITEALPEIAIIDEQDFTNEVLRAKFIKSITNPVR